MNFLQEKLTFLKEGKKAICCKFVKNTRKNISIWLIFLLDPKNIFIKNNKNKKLEFLDLNFINKIWKRNQTVRKT